MKQAEDSDQRAFTLFKEIMRSYRAERKDKTSIKLRDIARQLGVTENFASAIENGRAWPSLKLFLQYLTAANFDLEALKTLPIRSDSAGYKLSKSRQLLLKKVSALTEAQVEFALEQLKVIELFAAKKLPAKPRRRSKAR